MVSRTRGNSSSLGVPKVSSTSNIDSDSSGGDGAHSSLDEDGMLKAQPVDTPPNPMGSGGRPHPEPKPIASAATVSDYYDNPYVSGGNNKEPSSCPDSHGFFQQFQNYKAGVHSRLSSSGSPKDKYKKSSKNSFKKDDEDNDSDSND